MIERDAKGRNSERSGLFAGDDPFSITERWLAEAQSSELNDPNAISLATVDTAGLPNLRMVLLKEIEGEHHKGGGMLFYTNRQSAKGAELGSSMQAAGLLHWKSLERQIRFRGPVELVEDEKSDDYFASRHPQSRAGAIASAQSQPLSGRQELIDKTDAVSSAQEHNPKRPSNWGGYRIKPLEFEFWASGEFRLHDRFVWRRKSVDSSLWSIERLHP